MSLEPVDGNSIGGPLFEYFGHEMTAARGACAHCGAMSQIAELHVYGRPPAAVARCRGCGNVVIVVVEARDELRVDVSGFHMPPGASRA